MMAKRRTAPKTSAAANVEDVEQLSNLEDVEQLSNLGDALGISSVSSEEFAKSVQQFAEHTGQAPDPQAWEIVFEAGDHVYVGAPAPDKVHWEIMEMPLRATLNPDFPAVKLHSGMTGRSRVACLSDLQLHSKGQADGEAATVVE